MTGTLMKISLSSLVVFCFCHFTEAVLDKNTTENVCERSETYTEMVPVTEFETYQEEKKKFCWSLKKRFSCPKIETKTRERVVLKAIERSRIIRECCPGFAEVSGKCVLEAKTQSTKGDELHVSSPTQLNPSKETKIGGGNQSLDPKNKSTGKPSTEDGIKNDALLPEISQKNSTLSQLIGDTADPENEKLKVKVENSSEIKDSEKIVAGNAKKIDKNTSSLANKSENVVITNKFGGNEKSENVSLSAPESSKKSPITVLPTLEHTVTVLPINTTISEKDEQSNTRKTESPSNGATIQSQKENDSVVNKAQATPKKESNKNIGAGDGNKENSAVILPTNELSNNVTQISESENKNSSSGIQTPGKEIVKTDTIVGSEKETTVTEPKNEIPENALTVSPDKIITPIATVKEPSENITVTVENSENGEIEKNKENREKNENEEAKGNKEKSGDNENSENKEIVKNSKTVDTSEEPVKHELESKIVEVFTNKSEENSVAEDQVDNASKLENNDHVTLIWFLSAAAIIALITISLAYALRHFQVSKKYNVEPSRTWLPNHVQDDSKNYFFKV